MHPPGGPRERRQRDLLDARPGAARRRGGVSIAPAWRARLRPQVAQETDARRQPALRGRPAARGGDAGAANATSATRAANNPMVSRCQEKHFTPMVGMSL